MLARWAVLLDNDPAAGSLRLGFMAVVLLCGVALRIRIMYLLTVPGVCSWLHGKRGVGTEDEVGSWCD